MSEQSIEAPPVPAPDDHARCADCGKPIPLWLDLCRSCDQERREEARA